MFMNWLMRYRIQLYVRNSIWIYPSLAILAGLIAVLLLSRLEQFLGWRINLNPETARVVMATVATSLLTLVVLVASTMLLAVQLASAQLTPRIIAFVYRNNTRKLLLSFFVFTFTFSSASWFVLRFSTVVERLFRRLRLSTQPCSHALFHRWSR